MICVEIVEHRADGCDYFLMDVSSENLNRNEKNRIDDNILLYLKGRKKWLLKYVEQVSTKS